jgi:hypothetical protein
MSEKRKVEVFTAGCPVCEGVVNMVNELACPHCEVTIYNGVTAVPSIAVNGQLLESCKRGPITKKELQAAGIGKPL